MNNIKAANDNITLFDGSIYRQSTKENAFRPHGSECLDCGEMDEYTAGALRMKGIDIFTLNHEAHGGEDTIHLNLCVKWGKAFTANLKQIEKFKELTKELYRHKDGQSEDTEDEYINEEEEEGTISGNRNTIPALSIENHTWHVLPYGMNTGETRFSYYPIVLEENGIKYLLTKQSLTEERNSGNVRVLIGSLPLMKWGSDTSMDFIYSAIQTLGGKIISCTLSRVDLCIDLPGVKVDTMQRAIESGRFVCRGKTKSCHLSASDTTSIQTNRGGIKRTGFSIGKSNIVFRAYDKIEESKSNEDKRIVLIQNRWGDKLPEHATRCEFEIKRDALRRFGLPNICESIRTWSDYKKCRKHIVEYLVSDWLRLYDHAIDRTHSARIPELYLLQDWCLVSRTFREVFSNDGKTEAIKPNKQQPKPKRERLRQQATGCILSTLAAKGLKYFGSKIELVKTCMREITDTINSYCFDELLTRIHKKAVIYEGRTPTPQYMKSSDIPW